VGGGSGTNRQFRLRSVPHKNRGCPESREGRGGAPEVMAFGWAPSKKGSVVCRRHFVFEQKKCNSITGCAKRGRGGLTVRGEKKRQSAIEVSIAFGDNTRWRDGGVRPKTCTGGTRPTARGVMSGPMEGVKEERISVERKRAPTVFQLLASKEVPASDEKGEGETG